MLNVKSYMIDEGAGSSSLVVSRAIQGAKGLYKAARTMLARIDDKKYLVNPTSGSGAKTDFDHDYFQYTCVLRKEYDWIKVNH